MDSNLPNSLAQFFFSNIPGSLVSLARGTTPGRGAAGNVGGRVLATAGGVPYMDLTFSPPPSSGENARHGSARSATAASASAVAGSVQGALEPHRIRNINENGGQQNQMLFRRPNLLSPNGPRSRLRSSSGSRREGLTSSSNNNRNGIEIVDSDAESDADVEEVNMFIQHVRSIANRGASVSSPQSFHIRPPSGQVRTHGQMISMPGGTSLTYGFVHGSTAPRSYAINDHEQDAGATAENALEILDSDDDDDDDVIEILMRAQA